MKPGFFPEGVWAKQKAPLPMIPLCGSCGLYKGCSTPYMKWSGQGKRKVMILAEAPGAEEDRRGVALVGNSGHELSRLLFTLGVDMRRDCWLHNAVVCRPHKEGQNITPDDKQISACRANLVKALRACKPDVVIPLGKAALKSIIPLAWKEGEVKNVERWVGWQIPSQRLNTWICPSYHPSFLLRQKDPALELLTLQHLAGAFSLRDKPWKVYPNWESRVTVETNHHKAAGMIRTLGSYKEPLAFDYETTTLKPDGPNAEVICCSVSNGKVSVAFPWHGLVLEAMREILRDESIPKIAANMRFEERWTRKVFGFGVKGWYWDTVLGAHWLDCRRRIASLKFQSFVLLGMEDYDSHLHPYMEPSSDEEGCNGRNRLLEVDQLALLKYCGMDSLLEHMVAAVQLDGVEWMGVSPKQE